MGIVVHELMVRLLKDTIELGRGVPMDYVVWRKTPHEFPWLSRIGGITWRDRSLRQFQCHPRLGSTDGVVRLVSLPNWRAYISV